MTIVFRCYGCNKRIKTRPSKTKFKGHYYHRGCLRKAKKSRKTGKRGKYKGGWLGY